MKELILVRHGETVGNSAERLYGKTDIALSELGIRQMALAASYLSDYNFDRVVTSPLSRSIDGAAIIMNKRHYEPQIVDDFTEINFGRWEGMTIYEVSKSDPSAYDAWMKTGLDFTFPEGDSKMAFYNRVNKASIKVFNSLDGTILSVLHKGIIRGVLAALLNKTIDDLREYPIELGSIHILKNVSAQWEIVKSDIVDHLGDDRLILSR